MSKAPSKLLPLDWTGRRKRCYLWGRSPPLAKLQLGTKIGFFYCRRVPSRGSSIAASCVLRSTKVTPNTVSAFPTLCICIMHHLPFSHSNNYHVSHGEYWLPRTRHTYKPRNYLLFPGAESENRAFGDKSFLSTCT